LRSAELMVKVETQSQIQTKGGGDKPRPYTQTQRKSGAVAGITSGRGYPSLPPGVGAGLVPALRDAVTPMAST